MSRACAVEGGGGGRGGEGVVGESLKPYSAALTDEPYTPPSTKPGFKPQTPQLQGSNPEECDPCPGGARGRAGGIQRDVRIPHLYLPLNGTAARIKGKRDGRGRAGTSKESGTGRGSWAGAGGGGGVEGQVFLSLQSRLYSPPSLA